MPSVRTRHISTINLATVASEFTERFLHTFNTFDVDQIIEFYATDAVLNLGNGQIFRGRDAIRAVLANFVAPRLPMTIVPRSLVESRLTALVIFEWKIAGTAPDGSPVQMAGSTSDVIRQDADGYWRHLLDHPFGSATPRS